MGGMLVLEWAFFGSEYVRSIVAIATSARHSAWCISWGEAQRQSIYADPKYDDGYYSFDDPPAAGLGAARMSALLTYRSRNSFESRFGRAIPNIVKEKTIGDNQKGETSSDSHWAIHNDGHKTSRTSPSRKGVKNRTETTPPSSDTDAVDSAVNSQPQTPITDKQAASSANSSPVAKTSASTYFSAQSYLRYQADKFVKRFDSNCYIAITRKLDTHDVSRHRVAADDPNPIATALGQLKQPALVLGIESDGLFTFGEQQELAASMPNARLRRIESPEGHDAFLLQFEQVNRHILDFLHDALPDVMGKPGMEGFEQELGVGVMTKNSTFGEAEVEDLTAW